jgi:hypothetical protein
MKKVLPLGAAALASTLVLADATQAEASWLPEEIDQIVDFVDEGIAPFQVVDSVASVLEFLNIIGKGPELADLLEQVEARIVGEIQFWMDVQLDAATTAAFTKYQDVLRNPGQTSLNRERILFLTGSSSSNDAGDVFAELERLIWDGRDRERAMQLTLPFNALSLMMAQSMIFHDQYFPEEAPFSWLTFNDHYGRTYRADYQLIKVSRIMCYPGYNPPLGDIVIDHDTVFETSPLYRLRENRAFTVGTFMCRGGRRNVTYNPVTSTIGTPCLQTPQQVVINGQSFGSVTAAARDAARAFAREQAQSHFRTADDVAGLRDMMRELRFLSGGDQGNGINGDLDEHQFFDPWVHEGELCGSGNPWAYVQRP